MPLWRTLALLCTVLLFTGSGLLLPAKAQAPSSTAPNPAPPKPRAEVQAILDEAEKGNDALRLYEQALEKARSLQDKEGEAYALFGLGKTVYNTPPAEKAITYFGQALALFQQTGNAERTAKTLRNIGMTYYYKLEQKQKAISYYVQALDVYKRSKDIAGQIDMLTRLAEYYQLIDPQPDKVETFLLQALSLHKKNNDKTGQANILGNLAIVYSETNQLEKELQTYLERLPLLPEALDRKIILNNIGIAYGNAGQWRKALSYYEQALPLFQGDPLGTARTLMYIGNTYSETGELQKALQRFEQALSLAHNGNFREDEANILGNQGNVYFHTGEYEKALHCQQSALALMKNSSEKAKTLSNIAATYLALEQPKMALPLLEKSLLLIQKTKDNTGKEYVLNNLGLFYFKTHQTAKAIAYYEKSLALARESKNPHSEAIALTNLGNVYSSTEQTTQAQPCYAQARSLFTAVGDRANETIALHHLSTIEQRRSHSQAALTYALQAVALLEQLRANLGGYYDAKTAFLAQNLSIYYHALELLLQQHRTADAFALAQQTKARALLDLFVFGKVDLSISLTPEERAQEQKLREQADFLNARMMKEGVENKTGAKQRFAALEQKLRQTEQQLAAFTDTLYARYPDLAQKHMARTAKLSDLSRLLPPDTALLEYLQVSSTQLALFVATTRAGRAQVRTFLLPVKDADLQKQCAAFHAACSNPRKPWKPLSQYLYRRLFAPVEPTLTGKKRLIVCPDGPLWDIAFGALTDIQGHPLLSRFTLSMAYSATAALSSYQTQQARKPFLRAVLALADPDFGSSQRFGDLDNLPGQRPFESPSRPFETPSRPFESPSRPFESPSRQMQTLVQRGGIRPLPGTKREAEALRRAFPDAQVYLGQQAQEETFKREAGKYRYLHFATHGFLNNTAPMLSSLVLAQPKEGSQEDGFLTARELFGMKLNAELAVLSACNTGRGEQRSGEGIVGLTWALFAAGCPNAVVSQWALDDAATATLMGDFYRGLKANRNKAEALREAALKLRESGNPKSKIQNRKYAHPYFWAPFFLMGDGR